MRPARTTAAPAPFATGRAFHRTRFAGIAAALGAMACDNDTCPAAFTGHGCEFCEQCAAGGRAALAPAAADPAGGALDTEARP